MKLLPRSELARARFALDQMPSLHNDQTTTATTIMRLAIMCIAHDEALTDHEARQYENIARRYD